MTHEIRLFFIALQFLTRAPLPRWVGYESAWLQHCVRHFPLVGACVGAFSAAVLLAALWVFPPAVAVGLSMAATVWLTGGLHEDGFADTCDGMGGAVSRERALAIMKDSRIGTYGAMGLLLMLGLKATTLTALVQARPLAALDALVWTHAVSRAAPVLLMRWLPYAGDVDHAKAKPLATRVSAAGATVATCWAAAISAACWSLAPWCDDSTRAALPWALVAAAAATIFCARWLRRRLAGYTGDTLGATQQAVELVGLLAWLAAIGIPTVPHG